VLLAQAQCLGALVVDLFHAHAQKAAAVTYMDHGAHSRRGGRGGRRGGAAGMRWALAGGLLLDLAGIGPLGGHALALLCAAYAAGALGASFENDARVPWLAVLAGAAGGAVYGIVLLGLADSLGLAQVSVRAAAPLLLSGVVTTAVLVPITAVAMTHFSGRRAVEMPTW